MTPLQTVALILGSMFTIWVIFAAICGGRSDDASEKMIDQLPHGDIVHLPPDLCGFPVDHPTADMCELVHNGVRNKR